MNELGFWLLALIAISLPMDGDSYRLPINELGEACEWPLDPAALYGQSLGMYHCPSCGGMQLAGQPHIDYGEKWPNI